MTRWMARITFALFLTATAVPAHDLFAQDLSRGLRNYLDIMNGKKHFEQLSPEEREEVIAVLRRAQRQRQNSSSSSECRDALERADSAASDLATHAGRLKTCADSQDYRDDCSTEFRRVKNAHSEYEDAVASVTSVCN
jgi:hypothetical protein